MFLLASTAYGAPDPLSVKLPELPAPRGARVAMMGERMAINGIPISIRHFTANGTVEGVKAFYVSTFKTLGNGVTGETGLGPDQILSYQLGAYYYTVQLRQQGGSVIGKLVTTPTPGTVAENLSTPLQLPPGATVVNKVESLDGDKRGETLTIRCTQSLETVSDYMKNELLRNGWVLVGVEAENANRSVSTYQLGSSLLQAIVTRSRKDGSRASSQLLINWVKN